MVQVASDAAGVCAAAAEMATMAPVATASPLAAVVVHGVPLGATHHVQLVAPSVMVQDAAESPALSRSVNVRVCVPPPPAGSTSRPHAIAITVMAPGAALSWSPSVVVAVARSFTGKKRVVLSAASATAVAPVHVAVPMSHRWLFSL